MATRAPSLIRRAFIAFTSFRRVLKDPDFAQGVARLAANETAADAINRATLAPAPLATSTTDSALLLLGLMQKEGRLVDFLHEDIKTYSDQEVGAAARIVHQGCQRVLQDYLTITPVRSEPEGSRVTLEPGFDSAAMRPTGHVVGTPPFTGALVHRGWRVTETRLPQVAGGHNLTILAAAEVEL
jgi:hypothetical protein